MEDIFKKARQDQDAFAENQDAEFYSMKLEKESIQSGDDIDKKDAMHETLVAVLDRAHEELDILIEKLSPHKKEITRYIHLYEAYESNLEDIVTPVQEERERQLFELKNKLESYGIDVADIDRLKHLKQLLEVKEGLN